VKDGKQKQSSNQKRQMLTLAVQNQQSSTDANNIHKEYDERLAELQLSLEQRVAERAQNTIKGIEIGGPT
jgi:hypothetical protein